MKQPERMRKAPKPPLDLSEVVQTLGMFADQADDPATLRQLAALGNFLWFREQVYKTRGTPDQKAHKDDMVHYKALLPKEWQW